MSFVSIYSGVSKYFSFFSLYDFSLEKKMKERKFLHIVETISAITLLATVVTTVAAIYFSKPEITGVSLALIPFSCFSWFYTKEFHALFVLDAARNTIEESAKNVQISAIRVQEKREGILLSVKKLEEASCKIIEDSAVLSVHETELKKIASDVKEGNRLKKKFHHEIRGEIDRFSEINQRFVLINQKFIKSLQEEVQKEAADSKIFLQRAHALNQNRAALASIAKKVSKMMELKVQIEEFRLKQSDEFELMVEKIPLLADL